MTTSKKNKALNFEESLQTLTTLVNKMEQGQLSLEESLKNFEQGIQLIRQCQQALNAAQQKVQILTQQADQASLENFEADD